MLCRNIYTLLFGVADISIVKNIEQENPKHHLP
uniref:Uncharacterized protein n=1 Tax=Candidatus Kentrum sp. FM TaxID=2126340 RepID=A0A450SE65_9GAMM|nr:MAG: hypothetical protein BECKFM1743C_GA0114222_100926 [Candidatus Kentron sp. FM]